MAIDFEQSRRTDGGAVTDPPAQTPLERAAVVQVPALLSVADTARLLSVSVRTVRRRIAEGDLPAVIDHGRVLIRGDELRQYIDRLERVGSRPGRARRPRPPSRHSYDFLR